MNGHARRRPRGLGLVIAVWILLSFAGQGHAELLSPPPVPLDPWASERGANLTGVFPESYGWLGLERYIPEYGAPLFAWDFDLGVHLLLYAGRSVQISGLGRLLYQNESVANKRLGIDPSAIVADLQLRARFPQLPLSPAVWYRHDCKHDIARKRRDTIHDVLGLSLQERVSLRDLSGSRGRSSPDLRASTLIRLDLEYDLPLIFQDYQANANIATGHVTLRPEISFGRQYPVLFAEARGSLLLDDPTSAFATAGRLRTDGLVRLGLSWPERGRGVTVYAQLEAISDPWRRSVAQAEAVTLLSFGLMLTGR